MRKFHFTMILSQDHLFRMLALYSTLSVCCPDFMLYILCASEPVFEILSKIGFERIVPVLLADLERADEPLLAAKSNRSFHHYCWTLKSAFLYYIMNQAPDAQYYAHVDADLFFFSSPVAIFAEDPSASVYLTHHRNSKWFEPFYDISGIYNTGFVGFGNDPSAREISQLWRDRCLEDCSVGESAGRKNFGDQRHVEDWPRKFRNIHVVNTIGANAAMWNIQNYRVSSRDGRVFLDNEPLIFYHFSGLTILSPVEFNLCWYYRIEDHPTLELIYLPYIRTLASAIAAVAQNFPWFHEGFTLPQFVPDTHRYSL